MREVFSLFDPDGDGAISGTEVAETLRTVGGLEVSDQEASQLLQSCDDDGNGELNFSEFAAMMAVSHKAESGSGRTRHSIHAEITLEEAKGEVLEIMEVIEDRRTRSICKRLLSYLKNQLGVVLLDTVTVNVGHQICKSMYHKQFGPFDKVSKPASVQICLVRRVLGQLSIPAASVNPFVCG